MAGKALSPTEVEKLLELLSAKQQAEELLRINEELKQSLRQEGAAGRPGKWKGGLGLQLLTEVQALFWKETGLGTKHFTIKQLRKARVAKIIEALRASSPDKWGRYKKREMLGTPDRARSMARLGDSEAQVDARSRHARGQEIKFRVTETPRAFFVTPFRALSLAWP